MSESSLFNLIKTYRTKSVFFKMFLILTILCIILISFFDYFAHGVISKQIEEKNYSTNIGLLSKTSNSTDLALTYLAQSMDQNLWNSSLISVMTLPGTIDKFERDTKAIKYLSSTELSLETVSRICLYIPMTNIVYTSEGTTVSLKDFKDRGIIERYYTSPGGKKIKTWDSMIGRDTSTEVISENGRLFMFQDFTFHKRIGTLVYEVDKQELYQIAQGKENALVKNIYIYDDNDEPLFQDFTDYAPVNDILSASRNTLLSDMGTMKAKGNVIFYYQSPMTGWKYFYPVESGSMIVGFGDTFNVILPLIIAFFFISMGASIYITYSIYKPVNNLMLSVAMPSSNQDSFSGQHNIRNEFDFLKLAYNDVVDKKDQLVSLMENITPTILDQLFHSLLSERELSQKYIKDMLDSVGNPFAPEDRYVVLVAAQQFKKSGSSGVELNFYMLSLNNIITSLLTGQCRFFTRMTNESSIVIIMSFDKGIPVMDIKKNIIAFYDSMIRKVQDFPYSITIGRGSIYENISDIKYSYKEALEDLNQRLYFGDDYTAMEDTKTKFNKHYFNKLTHHAIQFARTNKKEDALCLASRITKEISENIGSLEEAVEICESVINEIIEEIISMRINFNETSFADKKSTDSYFHSFESVIQIGNYTCGFFNEAIQLIDVDNHKRCHKYIEHVKEYVAENYANSNISLNVISDYIKINPSYLSKLFKDNTGECLMDYVNKYRVEKAKQLLSATDIPIKEVGFKSGFNSIQSFIRVFKKFTGQTPGLYRSNA